MAVLWRSTALWRGVQTWRGEGLAGPGRVPTVTTTGAGAAALTSGARLTATDTAKGRAAVTTS